MPHKHEIEIIMNGVTGRMGLNQHLIRSILAIREAGGLALPDGSTIWPEPILVGRNRDKLAAIAAKCNLTRWTTDLDEALSRDSVRIYFDAQITERRAESLYKAIEAGKHVYCEKPVTGSLNTALDVTRKINNAGLKNGVVQDKLFLPGLLKLKQLIDGNFFGKILSVTIDFGYWVFEGDLVPSQRPSWNYRKEDGGGITLDMLPHWHYIITNLFGDVSRLTSLNATHIPTRVDERGQKYACTADDSVYAILELAPGTIVQIHSSWAVRVNRDDLLVIQVDGVEGSAVATLRECKTQHRVNTPRPIWNPDVPQQTDFKSQWTPVSGRGTYDNAFKIQWTKFLRHVVIDEPFPWDFQSGVAGIQLAQLAEEAAQNHSWVAVPAIRL